MNGRFSPTVAPTAGPSFGDFLSGFKGGMDTTRGMKQPQTGTKKKKRATAKAGTGDKSYGKVAPKTAQFADVLSTMRNPY